MVTAWALAGVEEGVVWKTVQERCLLHDLEDRMLDRGCVHIRERIEVQRDDGDSIRELL